MNQWLSAYLYFRIPESDLINRYIFELVERATSQFGTGDRLFFVRFRDEIGPHIRLRVNCATPIELQRLQASIQSLCYPENYGERRPAIGVADRPVSRIVYTPYQPEIARYGGVEYIAYAELFFCRSSAWVMQHFQIWTGSRSNLLIVSAICMLSFAKSAMHVLGLSSSVMAVILESFARKVAPHYTNPGGIEEVLDQEWTFDGPAWLSLLNGVGPLWAGENRVAIECWQQTCDEYTELMKRVQPAMYISYHMPKIIQSQMHMHNNRMGLDNFDEAKISYCVRRHLSLSI